MELFMTPFLATGLSAPSADGYSDVARGARAAAGRTKTTETALLDGLHNALWLACRSVDAPMGVLSLRTGAVRRDLTIAIPAESPGLEALHDRVLCRSGQTLSGSCSDGVPRAWGGTTVHGNRGEVLGSLLLLHPSRSTFSETDTAMLARHAELIGALVAARKDRTRLVHELQAVEDARAALEDFTFTAAHDLLAPSRKLVALCELLHEDMGGELSAQVSMDLDFVVDEAERMHRLTRDLLHLARVGSEAVAMTRVAMASCVRDATQALLVPLAEAGVALEIAEDLPTVTGCPVQLTQLVQNLVGNAIKFADRADPKVRFECDSSAGPPVFSVWDNGVGMEPELARRVFDPFVRGPQRPHPTAEPPTGAPSTGTGLGLAIVARVVERHRGRVWVETAIGGPTRFCFALGL